MGAGQVLCCLVTLTLVTFSLFIPGDGRHVHTDNSSSQVGEAEETVKLNVNSTEKEILPLLLQALPKLMEKLIQEYILEEKMKAVQEAGAWEIPDPNFSGLEKTMGESESLDSANEVDTMEKFRGKTEGHQSHNPFDLSYILSDKKEPASKPGFRISPTF